LKLNFWCLMPRYRTAYLAEFRRQMVDLVRSGRTPQELARKFEPTARVDFPLGEASRGMPASAITGGQTSSGRNWRAFDVRAIAWRQERDILAKAAAWFARESKASRNGFTGS
jgi:transposase